MEILLFTLLSGVPMRRARILDSTSRLILTTTAVREMSISTQASFKRISAEQLSTLLLSPDAGKVPVVDVLGDFHDRPFLLNHTIDTGMKHTKLRLCDAPSLRWFKL